MQPTAAGAIMSRRGGQWPVLGRLLGEVLEDVRPTELLVLGGSTGNGLEHINPAVTSRVVVVDVNPAYLLRLRERFPNPAFELDLWSGDVIEVELGRQAYDLVHAGLLFEYLEWRVLLARIAAALRPAGVLSVILQAPSVSSPAVTPTTFTSLRTLESLFRFVDWTALVDAARSEALSLNARHTEALPAGKSFEVLRFTKDAV
jgi:SAM-dependent methyltransferase